MYKALVKVDEHVYLVEDLDRVLSGALPKTMDMYRRGKGGSLNSIPEGVKNVVLLDMMKLPE